MDQECDNQNLRMAVMKRVDVLLFSMMMNLMESRIKEKLKAFSFPARFDQMLIISRPPTPRSASSMQFFEMDVYTAFFLLLCLLSVSALWTMARHLLISLRSSNANSKTRIVSTCLKSLWESFVLFFFEPYSFIPKTLSIRILAGVWLLAVLILNVTLSSVMRASFSSVNYELADSLKDLRNSKKIFLPKFSKGGIVNRIINLKSVDNEDFRQVRDHVTSDTYLKPRAYFSSDLYAGLKDNEYLFLNKYALLIILGFVFRKQNLDNLIYISKPISEDYMAYPYKFNSSRCYKINTIFERVILDSFETQWDKPIYFKDNNLVEKLKWRIPESETKAIEFYDLLSVDLLFCYGIILSCVVLAIELITFLIKERIKDLPLRRKRLGKRLESWN